MIGITRAVERIWTLIEHASVGMLATKFGGGLHARPLEPRPDRDAGIIWFVTDARGAKVEEIECAPDACLTITDAGANAYLSISGRAEMVHDAAKAAEVWRSTDSMWWPGGPQDPRVIMLRFIPTTAELWDGPANSLAVAFEFAKARIIGVEPNLGQNRKVTVQMR